MRWKEWNPAPDSTTLSLFGSSGNVFGAIRVRTWLLRGSLVLTLLMCFRTLQFFPAMQYVQEGWFGLCWLIFALAWFPWKLSRGLKFSAFEIYVLALILGSVLYPAWRASVVFGQPLPYGMLANRGAGILGVWLLLYSALRQRLIRLADIEAALLILVWGTFVVYSLMRLTLNPANFASYGFGFVTFNDGVPIFKFPVYFILYGVFYYALRGFRTRRTKDHFLAAVLFLIGALGLTERWLTVSMGLTLLFFLFRWRTIRQFTVAVAKLAVVAAVGLAAALLINPQFVSGRAAKFSDAFSAVATGSPGEDSSANARLLSSALVLPYIQKHPLLGSGLLSHQWGGGSQHIFGEYFYETDIGVVGVVYAFGLIGLLLFLWQYRFAARAAKRVPRELQGPLCDATHGFLLFTALFSLTTGICVWYPEIPLLFVTLLAAMASPPLALTTSAGAP